MYDQAFSRRDLLRAGLTAGAAAAGTLCFAGLLLVGASTAKCAELDEAAFKRALADPNLKMAVIGAAKKTNVVIADECPKAYVKILDTVHVEAIPQFAADGHIVAGSWVHDIFYAGCHAVRTLHTLVEYVEGKKPNVSALFPGSTQAGSLLQRDVFNSAGFQAYLRKFQGSTCPKAYVDDTALLDRETAVPLPARSSWREAWTISACGDRDVVILMYSPESVGTTFRVIVRDDSPGAR